MSVDSEIDMIFVKTDFCVFTVESSRMNDALRANAQASNVLLKGSYHYARSKWVSTKNASVEFEGTGARRVPRWGEYSSSASLLGKVGWAEAHCVTRWRLLSRSITQMT